ncbi:MAG: hypothetical protein A2Y40_02670 [Candidatus Margulisbacteria bacterium GWF2_35_9]|nr:MAG: hypothetical protein A2Y40_02670 [Candidatus Margulisbacteria bacterium GWF2_35_9]
MPETIEDQIKEKAISYMKRATKSKVLIGIFILLAVIALSYRFFFIYIQPNQMGLKQINFSLFGKQGLQKKVYESGVHIRIPIIDEFIIFPKDLLVYELADIRSSLGNDSFFYNRNITSSRYYDEINKYIPEYKFKRQGAANIQTNDGFYVKVDVSILFRIVDPYKVATVLGRTSNEYFQNGIARKSESVLKDSFGKLTTEEFYNSPLRLSKSFEAKDLFNEKIIKEGLQVEHVLVRYFEYSSEIQKNIEEKKLKDQMVFKEQAEAKAATEGAALKKVIEEGEATMKVELEKGKAYVTRKNSEKDAYYRTQKASGDLLYKLAEAGKTKLINDAYISQGSKRLVGLEMAKVLNGIELIVIPSDGKNGLNPLDMDSIQKLFKAY